ncbi:MAG: DEAD/DEAH box helicase [bacterium]
MTEKHLTDQRFIDFDLEESLQQGLRDAGFSRCTPIQAACLPSALDGKDVAGQAQTGTGKTVAFLLACCHYLLTHPAAPARQATQPRALILAPTRELAIQIHHDAAILSRHTGLSLALIYGGTGYDEQRLMLADGADILIGTPGRLIDFFRQGLYDLKHAQVAVMDEADRMFDLGFIRDIRFLLRRMPPAERRLNLLFSATLSFKVMDLAYEHMNDPEEIKIETDSVVVDEVTEYSFYPAEEEKLKLLVNLLKREEHGRILVFVNTRHGVERVAGVLAANGIGNGALSGDVPQRKREQLLEAFKSGERKVLVATDVAARGLHIPEVAQVYNFDLPQDADDYIHRIGRTARAGASGEAISFVCERYAYSIMDIEQQIGHALPRREIGPELLAPIERGRPPRDRTRRERGPERGRGSDRGRAPASQRGAAADVSHNRGDDSNAERESNLAQPRSPQTPPIVPQRNDAPTPITPQHDDAPTPIPFAAADSPAAVAVADTAQSDARAAAMQPARDTTSREITREDTRHEMRKETREEMREKPREEIREETRASAPRPSGEPTRAQDREAPPYAPVQKRFSRRYGEIPAVG